MHCRKLIAGDVFGPNQLFQREQKIAVRNHDLGANLRLTPRVGLSKLDFHAADFSVIDDDAARECAHQNVPAGLFESSRQFIGEGLRASARIIVADEIGQPQH